MAKIGCTIKWPAEVESGGEVAEGGGEERTKREGEEEKKKNKANPGRKIRLDGQD